MTTTVAKSAAPLDVPTPARLTDVGGARFFTRPLHGLAFIGQGIGLAYGRKELRWLSFAATAVNLAVYAGLLAGGLFFLGDVLDAFGLTEAEHPIWRVVAGVLLGLGWALASILLASFLGGLVAGELLSALSERTERLLVGRAPSSPFSLIGLLKGLVEGLVFQLLVLVPAMVVLLLIGLIPVVGQIAALILGWTWGTMLLAFSFVGVAASRHGLSTWAQLRLVFSHKMLALGFGGPAGLFPWLLVPILTPALVVGGTKLYLCLAAHGHVQSELTEADKALLRGAA